MKERRIAIDSRVVKFVLDGTSDTINNSGRVYYPSMVHFSGIDISSWEWRVVWNVS